LADGVQYPQGGFSTIIDAIAALATARGVRIRTGATVVGIDTETVDGARLSRKRARVTGVTVRTADGIERIGADVVVGANDLHHLETRLLPEHLRTYPESWWQRRDPGPGAVLAYLGVEGRLPELAHHTMFFTDDWDKNFDDVLGRPGRVPDPASSYVCRPS